MSTQNGRIYAALDAMIGEKLLFKQEKNHGLIEDSYIFAVPGSLNTYCTLTLTSREYGQHYLVKIECGFPPAEALLRELAELGKYRSHRETSIDSPDAQRVLTMFRYWALINDLRHGNNQLPDPDAPDPDEPSIRYA